MGRHGDPCGDLPPHERFRIPVLPARSYPFLFDLSRAFFVAQIKTMPAFRERCLPILPCSVPRMPR